MKTRLRELRKINKISQENLAIAVGVTRQTIITIENEKKGTVTLDLAYKLASHFNLPIEEVFLMPSKQQEVSSEYLSQD